MLGLSGESGKTDDWLLCSALFTLLCFFDRYGPHKLSIANLTMLSLLSLPLLALSARALVVSKRQDTNNFGIDYPPQYVALLHAIGNCLSVMQSRYS